MRTHRAFLPALATVVCVAILAISGLNPPASAEPPKPALAVVGQTRSFVVSSSALSFTYPASQAPARSGAPLASALSEGFEGSWPSSGWSLSDQSSADGGTFFWGKRNCSPHNGQFAIFSHGGGAQGSAKACGSQYPNNMFSWAVYGPFSLSNASSAALIFHIRGRTEAGTNCPNDGLGLGISTDGTNFNGPGLCGGTTAGPDGNGYTKFSVDLTSLAEQPQLWVAFIFYSNSSITDIGYTLDDLALVVTSSVTPTASATSTATGTPGNLLGYTQHVPVALKAATPTPLATPTTPATVTPTVQSGGRPKDGHWSGSTSQGEGVAFDVLSGGTRVNTFEFGVKDGGCGLTMTISSSAGGFAISNSQFSISGSGTFGGSYLFTGRFESASSVTGTFSFNRYDTGSCVIQAAGSWQASHP